MQIIMCELILVFCICAPYISLVHYSISQICMRYTCVEYAWETVHVCRFCKGNISNHQVTVVVIVPPVAIFLAKHPSLEKYDLSSLKALGSGGAPLKAEVINALKKRLPGTVAMTQGF